MTKIRLGSFIEVLYNWEDSHFYRLLEEKWVLLLTVSQRSGWRVNFLDVLRHRDSIEIIFSKYIRRKRSNFKQRNFYFPQFISKWNRKTKTVAKRIKPWRKFFFATVSTYVFKKYLTVWAVTISYIYISLYYIDIYI